MKRFKKYFLSVPNKHNKVEDGTIVVHCYVGDELIIIEVGSQLKKALLLTIIFAFSTFLFSCTAHKENNMNRNQTSEQSSQENMTTTNCIIPENKLFEKDKINLDAKETVVISDCSIKNGPGENYEDIGNLKYGDTVNLVGRYSGWYLAKTDKIGEFWINGKNVIDYNFNYDEWEFGIFNAEKVSVGQATLSKGNLVWILKKDSDRSYVRLSFVEVSRGYSGWIKNSDFTTDKNGVYFNQAFLKKGAKVYNEADEKSGLNADFTNFPGDWINIDKVGEDDWIHVAPGGGRSGWVKNTEIYIP